MNCLYLEAVAFAVAVVVAVAAVAVVVVAVVVVAAADCSCARGSDLLRFQPFFARMFAFSKGILIRAMASLRMITVKDSVVVVALR